jgi:hypothetical protein
MILQRQLWLCPLHQVLLLLLPLPLCLSGGSCSAANAIFARAREQELRLRLKEMESSLQPVAADTEVMQQQPKSEPSGKGGGSLEPQ